jgi:hypothetical protein
MSKINCWRQCCESDSVDQSIIGLLDGSINSRLRIRIRVRILKKKISMFYHFGWFTKVGYGNFLATYFFPRHKNVHAGCGSDRSVINWTPESRSASHDCGSADLDPKEIITDPQQLFKTTKAHPQAKTCPKTVICYFLKTQQWCAFW